MTNYPTTSHKYAYFWAKYRPALLKLMIDSAEGPQQYKFSSHEVRSANTTQKVQTFMLKIHKGKAVNNVRESLIAKDLLWILQQPGKAMELSETFTYQFRLDGQFMLYVVRETDAVSVKTDSDALEVADGDPKSMIA